MALRVRDPRLDRPDHNAMLGLLSEFHFDEDHVVLRI